MLTGREFLMNTTFQLIFAIICVISILEVATHYSSKESVDTAQEDDSNFYEFDDDPALKYSRDSEVDESIEIRQATGAKPSVGSFKTPFQAPKVKFLFCVSCGYRQAFEQLSQMLSEKFPGIEIEGANYAPSTIKALLSQIIGITKIALIIMVVMGRDPFPSVGMPTPNFFQWMLGNKLSSCLMLFMMSNSIESMLMSTGAFEIYIDDEKIWSKLESGRPPSSVELIQAVDGHLAVKGVDKLPSSFGFEIDN